MRRGLLAVGLLVLVAAGALLLAGRQQGCGDDEDRPECVAERFASTDDPSKCDLVAPELLEQLTGARGAAAREVCARNVARVGPRGDVRLLEREGGAEVGPAGAVRVEVIADGREGVMTLERRGGRWRITSFAE